MLVNRMRGRIAAGGIPVYSTADPTNIFLPMRQTRHSRRQRILTALLALISMLFMQLAVASYVCPMPAMAADMPAMENCAGMDQEQPVLCHVHADEVKVSIDKAEPVQAPAFIATGLTFTLAAVEAGIAPAFLPSNTALLRRSVAPPLAIRHCRFHI